MATRRYLNFDLLLEQGGDGQFEARVTASPVTDLPHVRFRLPFDEKSLKILLLELDPGRTDVRGAGGDRKQQAAKDFGGPLFEAIFTESLALAWTRSLDKVVAEKAGGLRLRLRVADEATDLAGLPWELLYDAKGRAFPAQSEITPLVRFLDVASEAEPIQVSGPLRVLAIISSPVDRPELDVEREWARIETAMSAKVREGLVVIDRLPEATVDALGEWLLNHDTHVIHFVGHGDFDAAGDEGFIFFQNERGGADPVTAAVLGPFVHDHDALRMIVMNACRSARVGPTDPYGGMAQGLVQQGATAVVAMQFPITDQAAVMFTGKFYGALAAGLPVDQAVSYARKALQAKFRSEWATPVLFMRSPDGNLFQDLKAPPGWIWHAPRDPVPTKPDNPDPDLADLRPTDLEVTDITGPETAHSAVEPVPRILPQAEPDPYQFLFEHEAPEPEPPEPEPPEHERPGPGPLPIEPDSAGTNVTGWVSAHLKMLTAAAAVLLLVIAAPVITVRLIGDDHPVEEPLAESQMLVAAGRDFRHLDIYLIDESNNDKPKQLTHAEDSWLPVLSPDRRTMIYVRRLGNQKTGQLRTASAIDGTGDHQLDLPPQCGPDVRRPSYIPGTGDLVLRCQKGNVIRLVRIDQNGNLVGLPLLTLGPASQLADLDDPTVSRDGHTVVFWGRENTPPGQTPAVGDGMSLYKLDLASPSGTLKRLTPEGTLGYNDPVFSQQAAGNEWLAWRAGNATEGVINYEVYAAPFVDGKLGTRVPISGPSSPAKEQDPSFSPDGKSIVYGSLAYEPDALGKLQPGSVQTLLVASVQSPHQPHQISGQGHPFWAVPAWSGR